MLRFAEHVSGDMYKVKKFIELDDQIENSETLTQGSSPEKEFGFLQSDAIVTEESLSSKSSEKPETPVFINRHVE
jgi:hypothetical protein